MGHISGRGATDSKLAQKPGWRRHVGEATPRAFLKAILLLAPLILVGAYHVNYALSNLRQDLEKTALTVARVNAAEISRNILGMASFLERLSSNPDIRSLDPRRCGHLFDHFNELYPQHSNLLTKDINGTPVCSALPVPPGTKVNSENYLPAVIDKNGFSIGLPNLGPLSKRWVVPLDFPIHDNDGRVVGTISAPLDLLKFNPFVGSSAFQGLPPGTTATLFAPDMTMLARSLEPEKWIGSRRVQVPELVALVTGQLETTRFVSQVDHIERIHGAAKVLGTSWTTLTSIPTSELDIASKALASKLLAGYGTAALALLGITFVWSRKPPPSKGGQKDSAASLSRPLLRDHRKQFLIFSGILVFTLGLFGFLFWNGYQSTLKTETIAANNLTEALVAEFESTFARAQSDLQVFVPQVTVNDLTGRFTLERKTDVENLMSAHLRAFPAVSNYRVFNADGESVFSAGSTNGHIAINVVDRAWFQQLRQEASHDFVISDVVIARDTRAEAVILAYAIRDKNRLFIGAVTAAVSLDYFQQLLNSLNVGAQGMVAVRRTDNFHLILRRPILIEQVNEAAKSGGLIDLVQSAETSSQGEFTSQVDNVLRIYALRSLPHYPISMIVATSESEALASWREQTILSGLAALAMVSGLTILFLRQLKGQRELRVSEANLASEVARFKAVLTSASDGIHILDADGTVIEASDSFCRMLGYPKDEIIGMNVAQWDVHFSPEALQAMLADELVRNEPVIFESLHQRKDGGIFDVEVAGYPFMLDGRWVIFNSSRDITGRKEAEANLRESEERFRNLVEGTSDWVWETDASGRFTWVSNSVEMALGIPAKQLLGRCRWELTADDCDINSAQWQEFLKILAARKSFRDFRYWFSFEGAKEHWISVSGSPRFNDDGQFLGYRGAGSDMSQQAEQTIRLRLLSTAVEQSPVTVVITDPQGLIEYINPAGVANSGYQAEEVLRLTPKIFGSGETPIEVYQDLWCTITTGRQWQGELRNRRKNGNLFWESVKIAPVVNDIGDISHFVAIKEDVTERRQLQDQLSRSNTELEQFAYVTSHDLRQPLRSVSSYLSLIERELGESISEDMKTYIGFAVGGAKRMDRLILDLLEYSRTGRSHQTMQVSLAEVVRDALTNLSVAIEEVDAEIVVADGLPDIQGDRSELTRLFQNLIGNAVKYHAADRRPRVEVGFSQQGLDWVISVRDNGIGIAPEDRERAFGIFQRLVSHEQYEGTGIGLAVCKKIVEHHKGRIWIESRPSQGSTFLVALSATGAIYC